MQVRLATAADIAAIINLERQCETAAHWTEAQYQKMFHLGGSSRNENSKGGNLTFRRLALVANSDLKPNLSGFLIAAQRDHEWELENIAVACEARRHGVGSSLWSELLAQARAANSDSIFLEVRESNLPARALYQKVGFQQTGRRRGYYAHPVEDAVLFRYALL